MIIKIMHTAKNVGNVLEEYIEAERFYHYGKEYDNSDGSESIKLYCLKGDGVIYEKELFGAADIYIMEKGQTIDKIELKGKWYYSPCGTADHKSNIGCVATI